MWQNLYAREVNVSNNSSIHLNNDEEKKKDFIQLFQFAFHSKWRTFFVWSQDFIGTILEPKILAKRLNRWYCNLNIKNCTHLVINIKIYLWIISIFWFTKMKIRKKKVVVGQLMTTPNENWSVLALWNFLCYLILWLEFGTKSGFKIYQQGSYC